MHCLHLDIFSMLVYEPLHDLLLVSSQFVYGRLPAPVHLPLCCPQIYIDTKRGEPDCSWGCTSGSRLH